MKKERQKVSSEGWPFYPSFFFTYLSIWRALKMSFHQSSGLWLSHVASFRVILFRRVSRCSRPERSLSLLLQGPIIVKRRVWWHNRNIWLVEEGLLVALRLLLLNFVIIDAWMPFLLECIRVSSWVFKNDDYFHFTRGFGYRIGDAKAKVPLGNESHYAFRLES